MKEKPLELEKSVKFGVIGTSHRGQDLIRTYTSIKGCNITALCERYEPLLQQAAAILNKPQVQCFTDHVKMLKEADIDAVLIFTEPEATVTLACEALEAGKHVMCEVPICYTLDDCWKIVLAVERSGRKFQLAEQVRYHPCMQAWRNLVSEGKLGKVLFARGEYLHPLPESWFWIDTNTGEKIPLHEIDRHPNKKKGRVWTLEHPIWYMPHELSPLLSVLDDRVESVTCLSTGSPSHVYPWFPNPDVEIATMRTAKGSLLNLTAGFTAPNYPRETYGWHWYQLFGTKGSVETPRSHHDKSKLWFADSFLAQPAEMTWAFDPHSTPAEAISSGHDGLDYWPMANFISAITNNTPLGMDVYKAVESAAPAILAASSAEQGGQPLTVPDFRPSAQRQPGVQPLPA